MAWAFSRPACRRPDSLDSVRRVLCIFFMVASSCCSRCSVAASVPSVCADDACSRRQGPAPGGGGTLIG